MDIRRIMENAQGTVRNTYDSGVGQLLDRLGLEQKRSTMEVVLPALAIFGTGLAVGAALGVMFAPKRGEELRTDIRHRIGDIKDRGVERYETLRTRGEELLEEEKVNGARAEA
ncbi:MAG: YtxH domain-containing protein [Acidimicrobiia bacterium]|nr:YtxH domain-containing protein [Acidimicrobiia bacterium]